jgi:UDP-N-acetyl-D-glucosamine dehydrogenase
LAGHRSVGLTAGTVASYDAVLSATDHDEVPYDLVVANAPMAIGARNACAGRAVRPNHHEGVIRALRRSGLTVRVLSPDHAA